MKPRELILHGLLRRENEGYWAAYCLDFTLYATGETQQEAMDKLLVIVDEYLTDALVGDDQLYANELLSRRAPLLVWLKFYWFHFLQRYHQIKKKLHSESFTFPVPMMPYRHA